MGLGANLRRREVFTPCCVQVVSSVFYERPWFANATIQGTYNWSSTAPPDCKYDDSVRYYGTTIDYECPYGYVFEHNGLQNLELKCETWADWHPAGPPNCIRMLHQLFSFVRKSGFFFLRCLLVF